HPLTIIASDGFIENGRGHPRTSGSFSKVLGRYVREEGVLDLNQAVRKMTIMPARRLEERTPAFARKGRLQEGMDADVTLFDPQTVRDRSTYMDATIPAQGIPYVIVGGEVVVDQGELTDARPGVGIRAPRR
ncbi:MAG: amidohydrolase family protein, partial [Longimicrobiales bacterium]|nr:amidohydrolase family protein [Longimicrobiales bacterium]